MLKQLASLAFAAAFAVGCAQSKAPSANTSSSDAAALGSGGSSSSNKANAQSKDELIVGLSLSLSDPSSDPDAKYNCSTKRIKFVKHGVFMLDLTNIKVNDWHTFSELEEDLSLKRSDASGDIATMKNYAEKMCEGVDLGAGVREQSIKQLTKNFEESKEYALLLFADCKDAEKYEYEKKWMEDHWSDSLGGKFIKYNQEGLIAGLKEAIKKYPECRLGRFL